MKKNVSEPNISLLSKLMYFDFNTTFVKERKYWIGEQKDFFVFQQKKNTFTTIIFYGCLEKQDGEEKLWYSQLCLLVAL